MNYQNESSIDMSHYLTENAKFATEIASRKRSRSNIPSECRELLQKIKNITFEIEESSEVFKELKETLHGTLERLYSATKKEKGLTLNVEHAKVNSKFNMINIPVRKKKRNVARVGEKYEKWKAAADIVIKNIKKSLPVNTVEEELVLQDDFYFKAPATFTTNRENIINISSDSEGEANGELSKSPTTNLSKEDLKTISNKQMLTDNVINLL